jgi:hypothetical protein
VPDAKTPARASPPRPRSGKRRRVTAGDLAALRREMWFAVRRVSALLDDEDAAPELIIRACNALALLANAYTRLVESTDLEAEIKQLREQVDAINADAGRRWAA